MDKEVVVGMIWALVGSWRSSCDAGPPRGLLKMNKNKLQERDYTANKKYKK